MIQKIIFSGGFGWVEFVFRPTFFVFSAANAEIFLVSFQIQS